MSITGAVMHNVGQIIMAVIIMGTEQIAYYLPALAVSGTISGILIGVVSSLVIKRIKKI